MLLTLALTDTGQLVVFYNLLFWRRFHEWVWITPSVAILILLWVGSSYLLGRYSSPEQGQQDSQRKRLITTAIVPLFVLTCVVVVLSWGLKVDDPRTFRSFLLPLLGTVFAGSALGQIWITNWRRQGQRWLLVGDGEELAILRRELGSESHTDQLLFCAGNDLGALNLPEVGNIDAIAVSESARLDDALLQDLLARRGSGSSICSLVVWAEQHLQRVPPELFSSRWLVQAEGFELQPGRWGWRLKRLGDLVVASGLLLLTAPLLLTAATLIRLEDGGPIFYGQQRTGLYGERILIWKLRSMRENAESSGARWASRNDARITTVGNWLRRLRIDELPQLVSVLRGDMSLIGPRPERPELELDLEEKIPHYRVRHWVRPGLSGWAQVCYPYGASIEDSRMKLSYDLYYLRNANLILDFLILIKTLRLVARGQGAVPQQLSPG
jgi:exopolysaccharide biosynthesis polyprenyl glycosylphosphotransferase